MLMMYEPVIESILYFIQNGYYIPFIIYPISLDVFGSHLLAWTITHKTLNLNYYINYRYIQNNIPKHLVLLKPFVRFTDTGSIIAILYHIWPDTFLHLTHNILFTITIGFWGSKLLLNMTDKDADYAKTLGSKTYIDHSFVAIWSSIHHILPYCLIIPHILDCSETEHFTLIHATTTFSVAYVWLIFIFLPWFHFTGDVIYSVLDYKKSLFTPLITIILMHGVLYTSNIVGHSIHQKLCIETPNLITHFQN